MLKRHGPWSEISSCVKHTDVETQSWTMVTGLAAFVQQPPSPPPPDLWTGKGYKHVIWMWYDMDCRKCQYYLSIYPSIHPSIHPSNPSSASTSLPATLSFYCHSSPRGVIVTTVPRGHPCTSWVMDGGRECCIVLADEWRAKVFFIHPLPVIPSQQAFHMLFL